MTIDDRDRVRQMTIPVDLVLSMLNGRVRLSDADLPEDAQVIAVQSDLARRGMVVLIQSAAFDPVPRGEAAPFLPPLRVETI